ncbi:hypothetical protein PBY51_014985 [Eleginops maclovinus]|uniref:Uncharacterized protein n=1 Tax=Eleginops maclovinus TaxID=56733 RepID=A0AAN7X5T7_ELEMC|nr:hypothetical protein PBY51_014985 [Eleginops maclovinus]
MLARRLDNAILKIQQLGWDNRRLNKEMMAAKGTLGVYQGECDNLKEKNQRVKEESKTLKMNNLKHKEETRRLTEKLRKSEFGDMNPLTLLPPISTKPRFFFSLVLVRFYSVSCLIVSFL